MLQRIAHRVFQRGRVVGKCADRDRLAAGFGDGGGDDGAVAVVDAGGFQRLSRRDQLVAGREHRRPSAAAPRRSRQAAGRQHADLARADARAAPQQRLAARDVGAGVGDELPGRGRAAHLDRRRALARSARCARSSPRRRRRAASRRRSRWWWRCRRDVERRRMAAGDHFGIEGESVAACHRGAERYRRRAPQSRPRWSGRTAAHRSAPPRRRQDAAERRRRAARSPPRAA